MHRKWFARLCALALLLGLSSFVPGQTQTDPAQSSSPIPVCVEAPDCIAQILAPHHLQLQTVVPTALPPKPSRLTKKFDSKHDLNRIGSRGIGSGLNFWSLTSEEKLGKELAQELEHQSKMFTDPIVTEYVNRIAQNLVRSSDIKSPLTVKVVDSDEVNAFSLPGGYLFVNTGLLDAADEEAEIAGVLAHELGHVAARHGTRTVSKSMLWGMIFAAAAAATPGGAAAQIGAQAGADLLNTMVSTKFSRDFENEADLLALQYLYSNGYDPGEYVQFFEKMQVLQKKEPNALTKLFSNHPPVADRIKRCQTTIDGYFPDRESYKLTTSNFDDIKARLASLENKRELQAPAQLDVPVLRRRTTAETEPTPQPNPPVELEPVPPE